MSIQEKINADLKSAILSKDEALKSILRVVIGEFNRVDKIVPDDKATAIIKKMIENAKDMKKPDEVALLENYIPKQLDKGGLAVEIALILSDNNYQYQLKDMGKIMGILKQKFAGQYDGKMANEIIKSMIVN